MARGKKFVGMAVNVKSVQEAPNAPKAPKVRANLWERGAGTAALAPVSRRAGATSSSRIVEADFPNLNVQTPNEPQRPQSAIVQAKADAVIRNEANPVKKQVQSAGDERWQCGGRFSLGRCQCMSQRQGRIWTQALRDGDVEVVSRLAGAGACLNMIDEAGDTSLIKAAEQGNVGLARVLSAAGARLDLRGSRDQTALMRAVVSRHRDVVELLMEAGANAYIADSDHKIPLVRAVEQNDVGLVEIICRRGEADPRILPVAVQLVLDAGYAVDVLAVLLRKGCCTKGLSSSEIWGSDRTALMCAVRQNNFNLVLYLARAATAPLSTPNSNGEAPLVRAAKLGRPDMVRALLESKCATDGASLRTTPLAHAARAGHPEVVQILLDAGAPIGEAAQGARSRCRRLIESAAERRVLVSTLHVEPSASEGMLDVVCTDMGGGVLASVRAADPLAPFKDLRRAIEADLGDCEFPPQLLLSDGRLVATKDDRRLLREVLGVLSESQAPIEAEYI